MSEGSSDEGSPPVKGPVEDSVLGPRPPVEEEESFEEPSPPVEVEGPLVSGAWPSVEVEPPPSSAAASSQVRAP